MQADPVSNAAVGAGARPDVTGEARRARLLNDAAAGADARPDVAGEVMLANLWPAFKAKIDAAGTVEELFEIIPEAINRYVDQKELADIAQDEDTADAAELAIRTIREKITVLSTDSAINAKIRGLSTKLVDQLKRDCELRLANGPAEAILYTIGAYGDAIHLFGERFDYF